MQSCFSFLVFFHVVRLERFLLSQPVLHMAERALVPTKVRADPDEGCGQICGRRFRRAGN